MLYKLSIGSNNKTKELESKKAIAIISKQFQGFSALQGVGYWQGEEEKTLFVEIETASKASIVKLAKKLCIELEQQAVAVSRIGKLEFIS